MQRRFPDSHHDRGQSLIEFALFFPVLAVLAFIIFDVGLALDRRIVVQHAIAEGARRGAVEPGILGVIDYTEAQSQGLLDNADPEVDPKKKAGTVAVCFTDEDGDGKYGEVGESIRVAGDFDYYLTAPLGGLLSVFGATSFPPIKLNPAATKRMETTASVPVANRCA